MWPNSDLGRTDGVTCLDCGAVFVRSQGHVGNYCEDCREQYTRD